MTNKQKIKSLGAALLLATPLFVASCTEETPVLNPPVVTWNMPADTVLSVNDKLAFAPEVVAQGETIFEWAVNGTVVSSEKVFLFQPTETGTYTIRFVASCGSQPVEYSIKVYVRKMCGGFYVVNEGWYGHYVASFNYIKENQTAFANYDAFVQSATTVVPGATGVSGALRGNDFYLITKGAPFVNKIDASNWTQTATLNNGQETDLGEASAISFLSDDAAILTSRKGAFKLNTQTMAIVDTLTTVRSTDVLVKGKYVYLIENDSVAIYNSSDLSVVAKNKAKATTGFAVTGSTVWAAAGAELVKIEDEVVTSIELPEGYKVYSDNYSYHPTSLQATKDGSSLLFIKNDGWTNKVAVAYNIAQNTVSQFSKSADNYSFYGAGIQVDPKTGNVYLIYTEDGWGAHYMNNRIVVLSADGTAKETINYSGEYWFPSALVFE